MSVFNLARKLRERRERREAAQRANLQLALRSTRDACKAAYNDAFRRKDTRAIHAAAIALLNAQRACLEAGA